MSITVLHSLAELEDVIERGQTTFVEVGNALAAIRDGRVYKQAGFTTFETYCKERWGWTRRYVDRNIAASAFAERLGPAGPQPECEKHVRPLTRLPATEQADAWREAVETAPDGKVTARHVAEVVKRRLPEPPAVVEPEHVDEPTAPRARGKHDERVLQMHAEGHSSKSIAGELGIPACNVSAIKSRLGISRTSSIRENPLELYIESAERHARSWSEGEGLELFYQAWSRAKREHQTEMIDRLGDVARAVLKLKGRLKKEAPEGEE